MKQKQLKTPAGATMIETDDGRFFRIHTKVLTPEADIPKVDMLQVQTHGYEVDKSGNLMVDENDEPIMLDKQITSIPMANIHNGSDTMNPGWMAQDLAYDPENPREDQKDIRQLKSVPKEGNPGDRVYSKTDKATYVYSPGQYANIRERRVSDFAARTAPKSDDAPSVDVSNILPQ